MPIKTTVITGATSGIGKETALALARKNHAVYMLVRDVTKGEAVKREIVKQTNNQDVFVIPCDVGDLSSVRAAAAMLKEKLFSINVLINNAGGIFSERKLSVDGYEWTLAVNHLGHFLLTMELMPLLEKGQARVINLSSEAHRRGKPNFDDIQMEQNYSPVKAYGTAKLYTIYFTKSLAEKYQQKGITAFSLHPGVVNTPIWLNTTGWVKLLERVIKPFIISAEQGAQTTIYLATAPKLDAYTGRYFKKMKPAKHSKIGDDRGSRDQLWELSLELVKPE